MASAVSLWAHSWVGTCSSAGVSLWLGSKALQSLSSPEPSGRVGVEVANGDAKTPYITMSPTPTPNAFYLKLQDTYLSPSLRASDGFKPFLQDNSGART